MHLWPPVVSFYDLDCFAYTWVTMYWWIMVGFDKLLFSIYVGSYNDLFTLVPHPIDVFELVWVDP
jgi:hypothetical protein